jgi:hypothetical protein
VRSFSGTMFHLGNVKFELGDINIVFGIEICNVMKQPIVFGWGFFFMSVV